MKYCASFLSGLLLTVMAPFVHGDSIIRITCDGRDEGAEIYLNHRLVGHCPADVISPAGQIPLVLIKPEGKMERFTERTLTVVDNMPQRVFMELTATRPNVEG